MALKYDGKGGYTITFSKKDLKETRKSTNVLDNFFGSMVSDRNKKIKRIVK